jgi:LysM repeat protein
VPTSGAPATPSTPATPNPANPSTPRASTPNPGYVTVGRYTSSNTAWNSTLSGIASHYKTTVSALMKLNPQIKNPNLIYTGSKVRVS